MIKSDPQPQTIVGWMDSLADPTRLRVLRLLERQELGVVELCKALQMPQSTVSRHLKLLSSQGWLANRRDGTANFYRMTLDELEPAARKLWLLAREQTAAWPAVEQDRRRMEQVLRARHDDAQAFFAGAASEWEAMRGSLYGRSFNQAALLGLLSEEWVVADLGCGTGALSVELAPYVRSVIGVDQSAAMLKAARRRAESLKNVDLRRGDLEALPVDSETCDAALMVLVLTYVADPQRVLAEAARILKPAGKLILVDLLRHDRDDFRRQMGQRHPGFDPAALQRLLEGVGMTALQHRPLPPETDARGPALFLTVARKSADNPVHP
ncbi:MAG: metalloregulator ArsR/SmtB family transcription factor [Phycisphaeraceae bacterium]|nr:metalloregulator ArsR/SmtB family transcription factor [Phycisphaeraceae bacterium]